jgi:hypothetical protein
MDEESRRQLRVTILVIGVAIAFLVVVITASA